MKTQGEKFCSVYGTVSRSKGVSRWFSPTLTDQCALPQVPLTHRTTFLSFSCVWHKVRESRDGAYHATPLSKLLHRRRRCRRRRRRLRREWNAHYGTEFSISQQKRMHVSCRTLRWLFKVGISRGKTVRGFLSWFNFLSFPVENIFSIRFLDVKWIILRNQRWFLVLYMSR